jgi:hypothetical protein
LEKVPAQTAPTTSAPTLKKAEFANPFVKQASTEKAQPPILTLTPPANAPIVQTAAAQMTATTEPSFQQPKPLPPIEDAKPISAKETVARWQPPQYIPNIIAATALLKVEKRSDDTPSPSAHLEKDPSMSNRLEQHLLNNLQL